MYNRICNTYKLTRDIIKDHVKEGQVVLDCTVGNGNDTVLLAQLVGEEGRVYGFDIQLNAINSTRDLLEESGLINRVKLLNDGHENIDNYINEDLDFVIYNLGYLPKGDKTIKTNSVTTILSIKKALRMLKKSGILLVTVYIGHEGGLEEKEGIEELLSSLNQKEFNVLKFDFINQINNPPILFGVEKSNIRRNTDGRS